MLLQNWYVQLAQSALFRVTQRLKQYKTQPSITLIKQHLQTVETFPDYKNEMRRWIVFIGYGLQIDRLLETDCKVSIKDIHLAGNWAMNAVDILKDKPPGSEGLKYNLVVHEWDSSETSMETDW